LKHGTLDNRLRCRTVAFDCYTEEEIGSCTPQVSTMITGNHMAGQNTQLRDQEANRIEDIRTTHQAKKAEMAWTRVENGR